MADKVKEIFLKQMELLQKESMEGGAGLMGGEREVNESDDRNEQGSFSCERG